MWFKKSKISYEFLELRINNNYEILCDLRKRVLSLENKCFSLENKNIGHYTFLKDLQEEINNIKTTLTIINRKVEEK